MEMPPQGEDLSTYIQKYLGAENQEGIKVISLEELPESWQDQMEDVPEALENTKVGIIPEDKWIKGDQPTESHAEKGLILVRDNYLRTEDAIAWLTHELSHLETYAMKPEKYEDKQTEQAFPELETETTYPNNPVEAEAFAKQFAFLQEQGLSRPDIEELVKAYYQDEEDWPFFEKLLDEMSQ
jgi:hypothetical protein